MKTMLRTALAALALAATTAAVAAPDHDHDRDRHGYDHRGHDDRGRGDWHHDNGWHGHRPPPPPPRYYGHGYYHGPSYYHRPPPPPPPRYYGHWERGHRYYGRNVVVYDYGSYRLRQPPRGYHWVREDNNFLLVAIATGIIADMAIR